MPVILLNGLYVSSWEDGHDTLTVRLFFDDYPESLGPDEIVVLKIGKTKDIRSIVRFLEECKIDHEEIYVRQTDTGLCIKSDYKSEIAIEAASVSISKDCFNADELKAILSEVYALNTAANKFSTGMGKRIHSALRLLDEQIRRIEIKSVSHEKHSTAGVLYAQHLAFLKRICGELK